MARVVSNIVEVCIFRIRKDKPEYLLLRRSAAQRMYPGLWQFVSGKMKPGEDAVGTARREVQEETGYRKGLLWTVPYVISFFEPASDTVNLNPLFAFRPDAAADPVLSGEHDASEWLDIDAARERLVWPAQRQGLSMVGSFLVEGGRGSMLTLVSR